MYATALDQHFLPWGCPSASLPKEDRGLATPRSRRNVSQCSVPTGFYHPQPSSLLVYDGCAYRRQRNAKTGKEFERRNICNKKKHLSFYTISHSAQVNISKVAKKHLVI